MRLTDLAAKAAKEAFNELTPAQKKVWKLCKQQCMSEEMAGQRLNVSRDSVRDRLDCAEKKFKKHLELILQAYGEHDEG